MLFLGLMAIVCGCMAPDVDMTATDRNITVVVAKGRSLNEAIVRAASVRGWTPNEVAPGVVRCQIIQRSNFVEIEVRVTGDRRYTIHCVKSYIPARKYEQWMTRLQSEIAKQAR